MNSLEQVLKEKLGLSEFRKHTFLSPVQNGEEKCSILPNRETKSKRR